MIEKALAHDRVRAFGRTSQIPSFRAPAHCCRANTYPAPLVSHSAVRSTISAVMPRCRKARASARPAIPPPTISTRSVNAGRLSSRLRHVVVDGPELRLRALAGEPHGLEGRAEALLQEAAGVLV